MSDNNGNHVGTFESITRTEHLAVARGYELAAVTWRERGDKCESERMNVLARERRLAAAKMTLRVVQ